MKIAIAQINTTVGDLEGNYNKIAENIKKAKEMRVELVIFPELTTTGYPPKDLLLKKAFVDKNIDYAKKIIELSKGISVIFGFVDRFEEEVYNAAALARDRRLIGKYYKICLPNYDVFDEKRNFRQGNKVEVFEFNGMKIGMTICEDIWVEESPVKELAERGADVIVNISASPFHAGKERLREEVISKQARENEVPVIYANLVGGQDELIFDGRSYLFNENGKMLARAMDFEEDLIVLPDLDSDSFVKPDENETEDIYKALVLGVRDYFFKNGFKKAIVGLSGGIDSALTATIAAKALGKENVVGVSMPSRFSSKGSVDDSMELAKNLGIGFDVIPINVLFENYLGVLSKQFNGTKFDITEENIQARIRGNILMALSNKFGHIVLATGNKSELSVGYATLYGDMVGGLAVISDLFKIKVYELCRHINKKEGKEIIPNAIMIKEPSAELRENQKDSDSLPVYEILDPILKAYVEDEKDKDEIIKNRFDKETVERVIRMVDRSEYKRKQAALGLRITPRAFGSGRRMPVTNRWNG